MVKTFVKEWFDIGQGRCKRLLELIRVCKPDGSISVSTGKSSSTGTGFGGGHFWDGEYPLEGMERMKELTDKYNQVYRKMITVSSLNQSHE